MRRMRRIAAGVACTVLAGCGGSGGGGVVRETPVDLVLTSVAAVDGYVTSAGNAVNNDIVSAGDNDPLGISIRGFYRFDLSAIPPGALITCAVFRTYQGAGGAIPYEDLGDLELDWVELGNSLDGADYAATALASDIATLSTARSTGHLLAVVSDTVQACLDSNGSHIDFRLQFPLASDADGAADFLWLASAENHFTTGDPPTLTVSYLP
jgi:hypothetical protein